MATPWKKMTEEQKARKREACRRYRMTAHGRAKRYEARKRWNEKNRERKRENDRKWYARKKEDDEWIADRTAMEKKWREENKDRYRSSQLKWLSEHPWYMFEYRIKRKLLMARDAAAYAEHRAKKRLWNQENRKPGQKPYRPMVSRRIPDNMCYLQAQCAQRMSIYLWENNSRCRQMEYSGYARELAIERKGA